MKIIHNKTKRSLKPPKEVDIAMVQEIVSKERSLLPSLMTEFEPWNSHTGKRELTR